LHSPHKMGQRGRTFFNVQSEGICAKHTGSESTLLLQRAASGGSAVASDGDASGLSVHVPTPSLVSTGDDAFGALLVVAPWVSTAGVGLAVAAGGGVVSADVEAAGARVVVKIVAVVVVAVVVVAPVVGVWPRLSTGGSLSVAKIACDCSSMPVIVILHLSSKQSWTWLCQVEMGFHP